MKIYGPPGTGKTTTLISTLSKLLERGYVPSEIAFLSHTKAAADEAKARIAQQYDGYSLRDDFKWFRTIHSACCGVLKIGKGEILGNKELKEFAAETGWNVKGGIDMEAAIDQTQGELSHDVIINAVSMAAHQMVPLQQVIDRLPDSPALASADRFIEDYEQFKEDKGMVDFTDMLLLCQDKGSLPVKVILVDECQDLSDLQWKLIHTWAEGCDYLYLAGDDDQAIYEFMGSSNGGFLNHEADKQHILDYSYRCAKSIGDAADNIIHRVKHREPKEITWRDIPGEVSRSGLDIMDLPWPAYSNGNRSVMVLFRHQKQCWRFGYALQDMDLPYTIRGSSNTTSKDAELIKIYLEMKHNNAGFTSAKVAAMMRLAGAGEAAKLAVKNAETAQSLVYMEDCRKFNWYADDWPRLFSRYEWQRKKMVQLRRMVNIYGIDIIGKQPMIDVSTYHGSKGREADVVVLNTDCYKRTWEEQMVNPDVETRLCYVGLTRAREQAIILTPRTDMFMRALVEA
jgi:DNA helicase-2/ATP-dependent DNA helicase PcrA